ncbi:MAG: hypothetical protein RBT74_02710 [Tenuifilaceae bacterium]|nr:hypothetical protein [Tenuifilaceae bacterium]
MKYFFVLVLVFLLLGNQASYSANRDSIQHRLGVYSMVSVGGDDYPGQMLGVEYGLNKGFYGVSLGYSQYHFSDKWFFPYWPSDLYIPYSYSSRLVSLTPFIQPIKKKWFGVVVNAGVTFSREDQLRSTITTPVEIFPGNYRLEGEYILVTNYFFGVTCGIGFDFELSKSLTLFANSKLIIMQSPGIGQILVGAGVRFNI